MDLATRAVYKTLLLYVENSVPGASFLRCTSMKQLENKYSNYSPAFNNSQRLCSGNTHVKIY